MKRDYLDHLDDLVDAMHKASAFTRNIDYEEFRQHDQANYAVVRALEIVGEAVKQLPQDVRERYPEVPWSAMSAMRDKLIHGYFDIDLSIVWETVTDHIPQIVEQLEEIRRIESRTS